MLPTHNQKPSLAKTKRAPGINNDHRTSVYQVYIAQLHRRALMLDSAFKDKVLEALTKPIFGSSDSNKSAQQTTTRLRAVDSLPASSSGRGEIPVEFEAQGRIISASVYLAPVKKLERMRIKLDSYRPPYPRSQWPLTAHITDPVRLSVVCCRPEDVVQVLSSGHYVSAFCLVSLFLSCSLLTPALVL